MTRKQKIKDIAPQMLYVMKNGTTNQYKIGRTNHINRRYGELQTGCPEELIIIKIWQHYDINQNKFYERVLHRYFEKLGQKIRENGEWFTLTEEQVNMLCKPNGIKEQNELCANILKQM